MNNTDRILLYAMFGMMTGHFMGQVVGFIIQWRKDRRERYKEGIK